MQSLIPLYTSFVSGVLQSVRAVLPVEPASIAVFDTAAPGTYDALVRGALTVPLHIALVHWPLLKELADADSDAMKRAFKVASWAGNEETRALTPAAFWHKVSEASRETFRASWNAASSDVLIVRCEAVQRPAGYALNATKEAETWFSGSMSVNDGDELNEIEAKVRVAKVTAETLDGISKHFVNQLIGK